MSTVSSALRGSCSTCMSGRCGAVERAVILNGIPQPAYVERVRSRRDPASRSRFLMLTRLTVEKGVRVVLEAMRRLPAALDIEVAIAGRGPLESEVRAAASHDRRIRYLGYLTGEDKLAALTRAGYLLLPSLWYENAPVAIVEAGAYGLGVVASDIGAIPEFVEQNGTGILFPAGDRSRLRKRCGASPAIPKPCRTWRRAREVSPPASRSTG